MRVVLIVESRPDSDQRIRDVRMSTRGAWALRQAPVASHTNTRRTPCWRIDNGSGSTLAEPYTYTSVNVSHMNESLDTVGWMAEADPNQPTCAQHAGVWVGGTGQPHDLHDELPSGTSESEAYGISIRSLGEVQVEVAGTDITRSAAVLWRGFGTFWNSIALNDVVTNEYPDATYFLVAASDVNDCGWIVAEAIRETESGEEVRAVLLRPLVVCPSDLNRDGLVGPIDLAILLGLWGAELNCESYLGDLDFDYQPIGAADLASLLAAWGACQSPLPDGESTDNGNSAMGIELAMSASQLFDLEGAATAVGFADFEAFRTAIAGATKPEAIALAALFATYLGATQ